MGDEPQTAAKEMGILDGEVEGLLRRAAERAEAEAIGVEPRLRLHRLSPEDREELLAATAAYVQQVRPPRRGAKAQPLSFEREVQAWWAQKLGYADAGRRQRLNALRNEVFVELEHQGVLRRDGGDWKLTAPTGTTTARVVTRENLGAWVLKADPKTWDLQRWIAEGGVHLDDWTVAHTYRAPLMQAGDVVLLWVSGNDPGCPAGIRALGAVTGPCVEGHASGDYWLSRAAKGRADYFARVDLRLLDHLVPKHVLAHHRVLGDLEVLRLPWASNPSHLSVEQLAALRPLLEQ